MCAERARIPKQARALLETRTEEEQWVAEQEERARRGVVYADLRCPVDDEELQEGSVDEGGECGRR